MGWDKKDLNDVARQADYAREVAARAEKKIALVIQHLGLKEDTTSGPLIDVCTGARELRLRPACKECGR